MDIRARNTSHPPNPSSIRSVDAVLPDMPFLRLTMKFWIPSIDVESIIPGMAKYFPMHFFDQPIEAVFDKPPALQKTPGCPDGFIWDHQTYRVVEKLSEWNDFSRRGRAARNMRPSHAMAAAGRGSLGIGRFYFRVKVNTAQIFDIYYDRAVQDADRRKGQWFVYRELVDEITN